MSDVFRRVKENIKMKDVAIHYGFRVNHSGLICCPFHGDKHPSMKVDRRFYCFSCGAQGDSIDFVSQYFGIGLKEAAEKLLNDFGIGVMTEGNRKQVEIVAKGEIPFARYRDKATEITQVIRKLLGHRWQLLEWKESYAPKQMDEEWHSLFTEALELAVRADYYLDGLLFGSKEEVLEFYDFYKEEVEKLDARIEADPSRCARTAGGE